MQRRFERNRAGRQMGIYSVCSAHRMVLEAACLEAAADESLLLIEATCNQVNQDGGYTGMTPVAFREYVESIAREMHFDLDRLILGSDHLGPNPWRALDAVQAMEKACAMVREYALAGYGKIHLDASMSCKGDPVRLDDAAIAERAARLCAVAEQALAGSNAKPVYVIGTEVPVPGGAAQEMEIEVTTPASLEGTLATHRSAFAARGLEDAWRRVTGIVVQPGVEFDNQTIAEYKPARARELIGAIERQAGIVFEAHSTDYQTARALTDLVQGHFAILKVGPELTFVLREALFGLARIEEEWIPAERQSHLRARIDEVMRNRPEHWRAYYRGTEAEVSVARCYSLSDRIRYYWPDPELESAVQLLLANLREHPAPLTLVRQYLPAQAEAVRFGALANEPRAMIHHRIGQSLARYARACGASAPTAL